MLIPFCPADLLIAVHTAFSTFSLRPGSPMHENRATDRWNVLKVYCGILVRRLCSTTSPEANLRPKHQIFCLGVFRRYKVAQCFLLCIQALPAIDSIHPLLAKRTAARRGTSQGGRHPRSSLLNHRAVGPCACSSLSISVKERLGSPDVGGYERAACAAAAAELMRTSNARRSAGSARSSRGAEVSVPSSHRFAPPALLCCWAQPCAA